MDYKKDFFTLLVKLPNGKVIQTSKIPFNSNIEKLKFQEEGNDEENEDYEEYEEK